MGLTAGPGAGAAGGGAPGIGKREGRRQLAACYVPGWHCQQRAADFSAQGFRLLIYQEDLAWRSALKAQRERMPVLN